MNHKNDIVLIRGLPGSGKTTAAKSMYGYKHFEADMYLEVDGVYVYDVAKVKAAHDWCVASAKKALEDGLNAVVSNTFIKLWEMQRYIDLGFPFRIIEMSESYQNIHGVPEDKIEMMKNGWQELPEKWKSR
jgi:predicted kinase